MWRPLLIPPQFGGGPSRAQYLGQARSAKVTVAPFRSSKKCALAHGRLGRFDIKRILRRLRRERQTMRIDEDRLKLTQVLHALLIDYWHDVDQNWGRNAPDYYTEDAKFIGSAASYEGREKIRAFYKWRENRGDRTVVHSVQNFKAFFDGTDKATCHWFMMLYAADGKPVLP